MFEELFAGFDFAQIWQQFYTFYNDFIGWYSALEIVEQVVVGIMIVLGLIGTGYLVYGVLWLAFQLVKAIIIGLILMYYMGYVVIKLLITAIVNQNRVEAEWQNSIKSMKYFLRHMYPNTTDEDLLEDEEKLVKKSKSHKNCQSSEKKLIEIQTSLEKTVPVEPQTRVVTVKDNVEKFFCTNCGSAFTSAMETSIKNNHSCFCQYCGQMFLTHSNVPTPESIFAESTIM